MIVRDLGLVEYRAAWALQQELFDAALAGVISGSEARSASGGSGSTLGSDSGGSGADDVLLLCEHPPVYTLGKSGVAANMLASGERLRAIGADFVQIDRGGDITYHGPGQLVGYPILNLAHFGMGLREYIFALEQTIIDTLAAFGITAGRSKGAAGVWLSPSADGVNAAPLRKIAAIGVRSSRFVTMHGFALNVSTDMSFFELINPCGFTDRGVTSMIRELSHAPTMEAVKMEYIKAFNRIFSVR